MNPQRYKLLMAYLPTVASIVNSFQSQEVQRVVYDNLMEALNARLDAEMEGLGGNPVTRKATVPAPAKTAARAALTPMLLNRNDDLEQEIAEGDSIHSMTDSDSTLP